MKIGEKIKTLRGSKSQREFASIIGTEAPNISRYESGEMKPSFEVLSKIHNKLGVNTDWLFDDNISDMYSTSKSVNGIKTKRLIQFGAIECGKPVAEWEPNNATKFIYLSDIAHLVNPVAFIARGNSMKPWIHSDYVLICEDKLPKNNEPGVVVFNSDPDMAEATFKYIQYEKNGDLTLFSENSSSHPPFRVKKSSIRKIYRLDRFIGKIK